MFQYATARSLSEKGNNAPLFFDVKSYESDYLARQFSLVNFNVSGSVLNNKWLEKFFTPHTKLNRLISSMGLFSHIQESDFTLHNIENKATLFTLLEGYWQSPKYFEDIRNILIKDFTPKHIPALPIWLKQENTVAVGVRRTDYLVDKKYGFIGLPYYEEAFQLVKSKVDDPLFIIFSDDIEWCKENFKNESCLFFKDENWSKDFSKVYLMSKCRHQIISNSSFYWWAAWLNTNIDKLIIRPSHPFNDMNLLYENHFPEEWVVLDNRLKNTYSK